MAAKEFLVVVDGKGLQGRYETLEEASALVRHLRSLGIWAYIAN